MGKLGLRTKFPTTEEKKEIAKVLFEKHKSIFDKLGIEDPLFIPKMNYYYQPLNCRVVGFFDSELKHGKDIYVEFVDRYHVPEDVERRLYRWTYDPQYKETLEQDEDAEKKFVKYLVPVTDFVYIENELIPETIETKVEKLLTDSPMSEMSIKDFFAILHRKPISEKEWLNELIRELNK